MNEIFTETPSSGFITTPNCTRRSINFKTIYNFVPISFILLVVGIIIGLYFGNMFHQQKIVDSIKLQRFLHKATVYNITPNVEITK